MPALSYNLLTTRMNPRQGRPALQALYLPNGSIRGSRSLPDGSAALRSALAFKGVDLFFEKPLREKPPPPETTLLLAAPRLSLRVTILGTTQFGQVPPIGTPETPRESGLLAPTTGDTKRKALIPGWVAFCGAVGKDSLGTGSLGRRGSRPR